jgi:hypothetical protein
MINNENISPVPMIFSPISIERLAEELFRISEEKRKIHNSAKDKEPSSEEMLSFDQVCKFLGRSRPSVRKYIRQGKLRVHYWDKKSPSFIKSEFIEDTKSLPGLLINEK